MREVELLRPDGEKFPIGKAGFLAWGKAWGWHYDDHNQWVRGQVNGVGQHEGYDIEVPEGTPLMAPCSGVISIVGADHRWPSFGLMVQIIYSPTRPYTLINLAHFSRVDVEQGHLVEAGSTVLGLSGHTGNTFGPHLHIGARGEYGEPLPIKWIENATSKVANAT
jgi:murein DD-endopeptidase MepM/ murein hydrolase activator NlpD